MLFWTEEYEGHDCNCPEAATRPNRCGQLPLNLACSNHCTPDEVIDLLIEHNPEALYTYDAHGFLPFHDACLSPVCDKIALLRRSRQLRQSSTLLLTRDGVPPLGLACEQNELEVVYFLVQYSSNLFSGDMRVSARDSVSRSSSKCQQKK